MTPLRLASDGISPSQSGPQPYLPSVTSDVVIDLSHWQAPVDFAQAKAAGIAAVILKATQGSDWIDVTFAPRFAAATAAGLLVGAYHFLDGSEPAPQVTNFLSVASGCRVLALDAETNQIGGTVTVQQTAEAAARLHMATGRTPLIYTNRYGPDERGTGLPNSVLSRCPLWLPAYNSLPVCPPGWSQWVLWQHTDGSLGYEVTPVPGIGRCDRSHFAGTVADLVAWWNGPTI
jgi:lysozyme